MIKKWVEYIKESLDFEKLSHTEEDVYKYTLELLENEIDNIFVDVHQEFNTSSGDITPEQQTYLDNITESLARLITHQVCQNIELKNIKTDKIDLNELSNLDDERGSIKEGDEVIAVYTERIGFGRVTSYIKNVYKFKVSLENGRLRYKDKLIQNDKLIEDADLVVKVDTYNDFVFPEKRL